MRTFSVCSALCALLVVSSIGCADTTYVILGPSGDGGVNQRPTTDGGPENPDIDDTGGPSGDPCDPAPCMNGGACVESGGGSSCDCEDGWTGDTCEVDIDECFRGLGPCVNASACVNRAGGYTCTCDPGWGGADCDAEVNECGANGGSGPCQNGATCTDKAPPALYECDCDAANGAWQGTNCDQDIDECFAEAGFGPCDPNGSRELCTNVPGSFECSCKAGYVGELCDTCDEDFERVRGNCEQTCLSRSLSETFTSSAARSGLATYESLKGFRITDLVGQLTIGDFVWGVGSNGAGSAIALDPADGGPSDSIKIEFFKVNLSAVPFAGEKQTATEVSIVLAAGTGAEVMIEAEGLDGVPLGSPWTTTKPAGDGAIDVSAHFGNAPIHRLIVTPTVHTIGIKTLNYTHACISTGGSIF